MKGADSQLDLPLLTQDEITLLREVLVKTIEEGVYEALPVEALTDEVKRRTKEKNGGEDMFNVTDEQLKYVDAHRVAGQACLVDDILRTSVFLRTSSFPGRESSPK